MAGNIFKKIGSGRKKRKEAKKDSVEQKQSETSLSSTAPSPRSEDGNAALHDTNEERNVENTANEESPTLDEKKAYTGPVTSDGTPIISSTTTDGVRPSDVKNYKPEGYKKKRAKTVPTAQDAAFSGPVRYDWVDVVSYSCFIVLF